MTVLDAILNLFTLNFLIMSKAYGLIIENIISILYFLPQSKIFLLSYDLKN